MLLWKCTHKYAVTWSIFYKSKRAFSVQRSALYVYVYLVQFSKAEVTFPEKAKIDYLRIERKQRNMIFSTSLLKVLRGRKCFCEIGRRRCLESHVYMRAFMFERYTFYVRCRGPNASYSRLTALVLLSLSLFVHNDTLVNILNARQMCVWVSICVCCKSQNTTIFFSRSLLSKNVVCVSLASKLFTASHESRVCIVVSQFKRFQKYVARRSHLLHSYMWV